MNQLELLKKFTTIVADTSDINAICKYKPEDATTNPSLILKAMNLNANQKFLHQAVEYARKKGGSKQEKLINASDKILVDLGVEILKHIPGYISSEVDARLSFNQEKCILKAKKIIEMYEEQGISRKRVLIKLAATWECIKAAEELKKDNIFCNLTLLFSFAQARACAESNVFLISPFVGRIYDWHKTQHAKCNFSHDQDPGVISVRKIYNFYKKHNYKTIIMGASFRNIQQILLLAGCDRLTISPILLKELESNNTVFNRKLIPPITFIKPPIPLTEDRFRWEHNEDEMAVQKLSEGIRSFGQDQLLLEQMILRLI